MTTVTLNSSDPAVQSWLLEMACLYEEVEATIRRTRGENARQQASVLRDSFAVFLDSFAINGPPAGMPETYSELHNALRASWSFELGRIGTDACSDAGRKGAKYQLSDAQKRSWAESWIKRVDNDKSGFQSFLQHAVKVTGRSRSHAPKYIREGLDIKEPGLANKLWPKSKRGRPSRIK